MGREAKINNKLTRKQNVFVNELVNGKSATQAALVAYDTSDPNTAKVIASENLTKPNIREALEESLRTSGLSLSVITSNLGQLANTKPVKISGDTVLKANLELLKLHGAYPDKKSVQVSYSMRQEFASMSFQELKKKKEELDKDLNEILEEATPGTTPNSLE